MSLFKKLFGKSRKKINLQVTKIGEEKPEPKPEGTGTTLRKPAEEPASSQKKEGPELTALEMAKRQDWEIKTLPTWQPGDVILDTYEVENRISGGMGHVYVANHNKWNVKLAIKSPNEKMLSDRDLFARILREANSWIELGLHPNIAYCYYVRNIEDVPHIIVEYVDGGNLRQWIEDGKCIDYKTNLDLAIQFCHGMEYAHSKGMIHRDIKPENVLMTEDGILKITDFGLVRDVRPGSGDQVSGVRSDEKVGKTVDHGLTTVGTFMGTPRYISPEQAEDPTMIDERADIFSFGVCLYEMFSGNKPYRITYGEKQDPPDPVALSGDNAFHKDIASVLKKCVQWELKDRFQSFKEIRQEFIQIYRILYKKESPYADLKIVDIEADGLNNQGVSYFELGRKENAVECWEKALEINNTHLEAKYNHSLIEWRSGRISDSEVLRRIDDCGNNLSVDKEKYAELKAYIQVERFAPDFARDVLKDFPHKYERLFSDKDLGSIRLTRSMEGYTFAAESIAITPDNRYAISGTTVYKMASGGFDHGIQIRNLETGENIRTMVGHTDYVISVAITPNGHYAVSGSSDKILRMWNLESGNCVRAMNGHSDRVNSVVVTRDGQHVISGSYDKTLRMWNLESGHCVRTMKGHKAEVTSVAITPNGHYAVSGSGDKTLRMWNLESGHCVRTMEGHKAGVKTVAITRGGHYAVSGSGYNREDNTVRIWDLNTGQCVRVMEEHTNTVRSVSLAPKGRYIISGSKDKTIRLWDMETGQCVRTIEAHSEKIMSVCSIPSGRFVVSGSVDKTFRVWDFDIDTSFHSNLLISIPKGFDQRAKEEESLKESIRKAEEEDKKGDYKKSFTVLYKCWNDIGFSHRKSIERLYSRLMRKGRIKGLAFTFHKRTLAGHCGCISAIVPYYDSQYVVSTSDDYTLRLWDILSGQCVHTMEGHTSEIHSVDITPDGRYVVSRGWDNALRVWDMESGQCMHTMEGTAYSKVAITPDGQHAVFWSDDKTLKMLDLESGKCAKHIEIDHGIIRSVYSTRNGCYAILNGREDTLRLLNFETGKCVHTLKGHEGHGNRFISVSIDGRFAVTGSLDKTLRMWDLETGECVKIMKGHWQNIRALALTPDCRYAVTGAGNHGMDNTLRIWDLETGKCIREMTGHTESVSSVAITPDSQYVVSSGGYDCTIRLWDLETGQCLKIMDGHKQKVSSLALSPDARYIISGSDDKTIRVWELIWDLEFD